jgi:hypothetical protein
MTDKAQPADRSRRITVAVLVVVAVLAGIAATLVALTLLGRPGPSAGADATPTLTATPPDATPDPTALATAEPTPEPSPQALAADTIAVATVNDLNVREHPGSDAKSIGHLSSGDRVYVLEGPEQADGYGWYQVATLDQREAWECTEDCPARMGWVAGTSETEPWLTPEVLSCPPTPKLKAFTQLDPFERLACYGDQPLTLRGAIWQPCCGYIGATVYEPNWLSWPSGPPSLSYTEPLHSGVLLRFDPADGLEEPDYADIVRVTGHMDDPAAATCTVRIDESALYEDPTLTVDPEELAYAPIGCRTQFVVDSIDILGNTGETCGC